MFSQEIYIQRRQKLKAQLGSGLALLLGNSDSPYNALDNCYPFRQDSSFLYLCGLDQLDLALLIDIDHDRELLCGREQGLEEAVWNGRSTTLQERADLAGIAATAPIDQLAVLVRQAIRGDRPIHYLPCCRAENRLKLAQLLERPAEIVAEQASQALVAAVVALRSVKEREEVAELDEAAALGAQLHRAAREMARPGVYEWQIAGELQAFAARAGRMLSFPPIVTVHGEILHNHDRSHQLQQGDLLLIDAGVESARHYASDQTRTLSVGSCFSEQQREIYAIVRSCLARARQLVRPGIPYLDVHLEVCRTLTAGMQQLGLMRGDADESVAAGAHALFMPHGLGHMLGLDVHDMEDLGEDAVGYDDRVRRSRQFGTARLRLGRELRENFALTVEPGVYFIPGLIEQWRTEQRHADYIDYAKLEKYYGFGGIRLEDDILVTSAGNRLLGTAPPLASAQNRVVHSAGNMAALL